MPASRTTFPNCVPVQPGLTPPTVFDNVFWDNRAGSYDSGFVRGIGLPGDPDADQPLGSRRLRHRRRRPEARNERHPGPDRPHRTTAAAATSRSTRACRRRTTRRSGSPRSAATRTSWAARSSPSTSRRRRMGNYKLSASSPGGAAGVIDNGVRCIRVTATDVVAAPTCSRAGRHDGRPARRLRHRRRRAAAGRGVRHGGGRVPGRHRAQRRSATRPPADHGDGRRPGQPRRPHPRGRWSAARRRSGSRAPARTASAASPVPHGATAAIRSIAMRRTGTTFRARTRTLAPGTVPIRVVITQPPDPPGAPVRLAHPRRLQAPEGNAMTDHVPTARLSRRALLKIGGAGLVAAAGAATLGAALRHARHCPGGRIARHPPHHQPHLRAGRHGRLGVAPVATR